MSVRYPMDPFAVPNRPDIPLSPPRRRRPIPSNRRLSGVRRAAVAAAGFTAASLVLAGLLFTPVLVQELSRIDAVMLSGEVVPSGAFTARIGALFLGTLIVAVALVSLFASAALVASRDPRANKSFRADPYKKRRSTKALPLDEHWELEDVQAL